MNTPKPLPLALSLLIAVFSALVALAVSSGAHSHDAVADRGRSVVRWRRDQLVQSGLPLPLAVRAARDARYDVHALIELLERGCPPELAVRILAPDDGAGAA